MTYMILAAAAASLLALSPAMADGHGDHSHDDHAAHTGDAVLTDDIRAALDAGGSLVTAEVNGMVCDFCATAMTRTFGRRDEVAAVHVDLDTKVVQVVLKAGESMSDETMRDVITRSGYETSVIRRGVTD